MKMGQVQFFTRIQFKKIVPVPIFLIVPVPIFIAIFLISGCARKPAGDVREFHKGYFKDKVSTAQGFSEGVGPTVEKAATQEIKDLGRRETKEYDFGDDTSDTLTIKAWEALNHKDEKGALLFTERCFELYADKAKKQGSALSDFPERAGINMYQQMNDVGTCYFIRGEFFKYKKDWQKAIESYQTLIDEYPFAQYWDPKGWYWKPAVIAKDEIRKINEGYYE